MLKIIKIKACIKVIYVYTIFLYIIYSMMFIYIFLIYIYVLIKQNHNTSFIHLYKSFINKN